jgi:Macrocin-O-methyltransferase (TylF)
LNELKANRTRTPGVDYLRALCFLKGQWPGPAIEALKEEVRLFPQNHQAASLLEKLLREHLSKVKQRDSEFRKLFETIRPYTMIHEARLFSLFSLAKEVCQEDLPGNFVECGVAAGGSSALLAAVIARYSRRPRRLFSFDTFEGMPTPSTLDICNGQEADKTGWGTGTCAAPETSVREICGKLGVENLVQPVKGLFADTLPVSRDAIGPIAFLHMDSDWYESTRTILEHLYEQVVPGGRIQVDDYGYWDGCTRAFNEFQAGRGQKFTLHEIDGNAVWMRK